MSVSVIGLDYDNVDGLQASLAAHAAAHRQNGDILLNLNDAAAARAAGRNDGPKKGDPRPPHVHRPFPKHLYHADGRELVVKDSTELQAAEDRGFRKEPYPVVRVAVGDPKAEKAALELKLREADGKLATQNELLLQLSERLGAVEKANKSKKTKADGE